MLLSTRSLTRTVAGICAVALVATSAFAQPQRDDGRRGDRHRAERGQKEHSRSETHPAGGPRVDAQRGPRSVGAAPSRWVDTAHGHNHAYPAPGRYVRTLPPQARPLAWRGVNYRYYNNVWYGSGPRGWVVVRPPYGAIIPWRPALFTVVTVAGLAYLYANGTYYREYAGGGYEVVAPPAAQAPIAALPAMQGTFVYPRNGQSAQLQASDEYECHRWAVGETGFDPTAAAVGQGSGSARAGDYERARGACLDARGYTVR